MAERRAPARSGPGWGFRRRSQRIGCGVALAAVLLGSTLSAAAAVAGPSVAARRAVASDKLSGALTRLVTASAPPAASASRIVAGGTIRSRAVGGLPASGPGSILRDESGRVLTYVRVADTSRGTLDAIKGSGAQVRSVDNRLLVVTASVAVAGLARLASIDRVRHIDAALAPRYSGIPALPAAEGASVRGAPPAAVIPATCPASVHSEGDAVHHADTARSTFSIDGSGQKVGILSNTFNFLGGQSGDVTAGELPGAANPCGRTTNVSILQEGPAPSGSEEPDEGRAMAQIVHDLAPGAALEFASGSNGLFSFADNVRALRSAGSTVIVDDLSYLDEPFYQEGPVDLSIDSVVAQGAVYATSAGNETVRDDRGNSIGSYEAPGYRPTTCPFGLPLTCHDWNPGAAKDPTYSILLPPRGGVLVDLQWSESWNNVGTDLDIGIFDGAGHLLADSSDPNTGAGGTQRPVEVLAYGNPSFDVSQTVSIVIQRILGGAPRFKMIDLAAAITSQEYNTSQGGDVFGPTIFGHSSNPNAISVGAVAAATPGTLEFFSSYGPTLRTFGPVPPDEFSTVGAPPIPPITLVKPDLVAADRVHTSFFPSGPDHSFAGTSASAPHVAAVAALVRQGWPWTPVGPLLVQTADPITVTVPGSAGAGRMNALAAATYADQVQHFSNFVYDRVLGRVAEPGGLGFWSAVVVNTKNRGIVATGFVYSLEYRRNLASKWFHDYLDRTTPDPAGEDFFAGLVGQGVTDEIAQSLIIASDEYFASNGGTNDAWVEAFYLDVLKRNSDTAGKQYFVDRLAAGASRASVSGDLFFTPEYLGKALDAIYLRYLGRAADEGGRNFWIGRLQSGSRDERIIAEFTGSDEFFGLAQGFQPGP